MNFHPLAGYLWIHVWAVEGMEWGVEELWEECSWRDKLRITGAREVWDVPNIFGKCRRRYQAFNNWKGAHVWQERPGPFLAISTFFLDHGSQIFNPVGFIASPICHFLFCALPSLLKKYVVFLSSVYNVFYVVLLPRSGTAQNMVHVLLCMWVPGSCRV